MRIGGGRRAAFFNRTCEKYSHMNVVIPYAVNNIHIPETKNRKYGNRREINSHKVKIIQKSEKTHIAQVEDKVL